MFILLAASGSGDPAGTVVSAVLLSPILWWLAWGVAGLFQSKGRHLVAGSAPQIRVGRPWQSSGTRQLRQDSNARLLEDRGGILLRRRIWFVASGTPPFEIPGDIYDRACEIQADQPWHLTAHRDRQYWWYQDAFYWTNADYGSQDVKALLFARQRQRERELEHAHALVAAASSPASRKRDPIPKDVKHAVWKRDAGRCVECGSDFDLQYDHVIPFAMGGADSVENLQLLCARCNQTKGGRL